jgi:coatomer subunit beta
MHSLSEIRSGRVFRGILWILGEYLETTSQIEAAFREIRNALGEIPIVASEQKLLDDAAADGNIEDKPSDKKEVKHKPKVLADGTYATETAYTSVPSASSDEAKTASRPVLRGFLWLLFI